MVVGVETEPSFAPDNAEELFEGYWVGHPGRTYDISPDRERFLMIKETASDKSRRFGVSRISRRTCSRLPFDRAHELVALERFVHELGST